MLKTRVAIFSKGSNTALIGLNTSPNQNFLARADPRFRPGREMSAVSMCDSTVVAESAFAHSLRKSLENGWTLAYYGPVLRG